MEYLPSNRRTEAPQTPKSASRKKSLRSGQQSTKWKQSKDRFKGSVKLNLFSDNINNIDKLLAKLSKRGQGNAQINKLEMRGELLQQIPLKFRKLLDLTLKYIFH